MLYRRNQHNSVKYVCFNKNYFLKKKHLFSNISENAVRRQPEWTVPLKVATEKLEYLDVIPKRNGFL